MKQVRFELNDFTQEWEMIVEYEITRINNKPRKNTNGTEYFLVQGLGTYHTGETEEFSTCIWATLQEDIGYVVGDHVLVAMQVEGDYAGYSKIFLDGPAVPNMSEFAKLLAVHKTGKPAEAATAPPEGRRTTRRPTA